MVVVFVDEIVGGVYIEIDVLRLYSLRVDGDLLKFYFGIGFFIVKVVFNNELRLG